MTLEDQIVALAQAIGLDIKALMQPGFTTLSLWAEESAALTANAFEWSWGNGDEAPANGGFPVPEDCELYKVSITCSIGTGPVVEVYKNGVATGARNVAGGQSAITELTTPVSFSAGDVVDFRTVSIGTGVTGGARAGAHFRVPISGLKGADGLPGAEGAPGNDGVPSACMRVPFASETNVNTDITLSFGTATINTIAGSTVNAGNIALPAGNYKVTAELSLTSTVQRSNIGVRFTRNGLNYSERYGGNYIRSTGGHNEAGDSISDLINLAAAGFIGVETFAQAAAGNVALDGTRSRLLIQKLS